MYTPKAYEGMVELPFNDRAGAATSLFADNLSLSNGHPPDLDTSFTTQMAQVTQTPSNIHPDLQTPPDLYLFTYKSAIPVADAVRGFYAAAGQNTPELEIINADRTREFMFFQGGNEEAEAAESERLAELIAGKSHVCVVEQYVYSGRTLAYARHLLENAGVEVASAIRGYDWYHDAEAQNIDVEGVTSRWQSFMDEIGRAAYQRANQGANTNA